MKQKTVFACQECGAQSSKWMGRCADCGAWNSLVEERPVPEAVTAGAVGKRYSLAASPRGRNSTPTSTSSTPSA